MGGDFEPAGVGIGARGSWRHRDVNRFAQKYIKDSSPMYTKWHL